MELFECSLVEKDGNVVRFFMTLEIFLHIRYLNTGIEKKTIAQINNKNKTQKSFTTCSPSKKY